MPRPPFVRPVPDPANAPTNAHLQSVLAGAGCREHVAALAALVAVAAGPLVERQVGDQDQIDGVVEGLGVALRELPNETATEPVVLIASAQWLLTDAFRYTAWKHERPALVARLAAHLSTRHLDCAAAIETYARIAKEAHAVLRETGLIRELLSRGVVDPCRFLDAEKIRTERKGLGGNWSQPKRERDPTLPDYWASLDPTRAMDAFLVLMKKEPAETLGAFASGLARGLSLNYPGSAAHLYPLLGPLAQTLCERRRTEGLANDCAVTTCCWSYARWALEANPELLPEDRRPLRDLALSELGKMRGLLRTDDETAAARFAEHQSFLEAGMFYVLRTDRESLWDVMRRLFLALRELRHPAVLPDLRTWEEADLPRLPEPWTWVPRELSTILELFLGRELERDRQLEELRASFARFCLDRLKTRDAKREKSSAAADELVEPEPVWRLGYIQAARCLASNPGGRGHLVLRWSAENDPDERVRAEAAKAHEALRHSRGLPDGISPRRAVHEACWWLRQAHLIAVGGTPDEQGAQRTFRKEVRRARELDERTE